MGNKGDRPQDLSRSISVWKLLKYADSTDLWLMMFGTLGLIGDGLSTPMMMIVLSGLMNTLGNGPSSKPNGFVHSINKGSVNLLYIAVGVWVAAFLEAFCWTRTGERQASRISRKYLRAVLRQDVGFFDNKGASTSEVVTSVSNDTLVIQDVLSEKVPNFVMNASTFFGSYFAAVYLSWRLAVVAFPFVILLVIPGIMYGRLLIGLARKIQAEYNKAGNVAEQALSSIRTVFSFVGEQRTITKFSAALDKSVKLGLKQALAKGMAIGSSGISFVIWALLAWYGSSLVIYHGVKGGKLFSTGLSMILGGRALGTALPNISYFSEACSASYRIFEMIDRVPDIDSDDREGQILQNVSGEIEYKNVEFAYPSRPENTIFCNFCLTIPPSQRVALVGGSGSGKSTAIALLERFYDPVGGEILLDGVNIKTLQLKWLRDQMGLVSQEPALFATSIKENILFGKEGASMDQLIAAAKSANAHNFISNLPEGYDTLVGERGVQMSGGQKQRIAIARAMLKDPRILLLDEATSALDAESEKIVQDALDRASLGRTTVVIVHRLSTIRNADSIAVVQAGHVIESGSHEDLIQREHGAYAALVDLQNRTANSEDVREGDIARASRESNGSRVSRTSSAASDKVGVGHVEDSRVVESTKVYSPPSFHRLLLVNAPEWKQALMGCFGAIAFGAVQPVSTFFLGSMVSVFYLKDNDEIKSKTRTYSLIFLSIAIVSFAVNMIQHYNFGAMGEFLTKRVRERMLSKILTFEVGWFDQEENSSGAVCSRLATEANTLSAVTIAFTMGLIIAWRLAVLMIAMQPLLITCYYLRKVLLKTMSAKALKAQVQGSQLAAEAVANHRTISAFSSQERILNLFEHTQKGPHKESMRQSWFAGLGLGTSQSLTLCSWALDFWYGGKLVRQGYITSKAFSKTFLILVSTGRVIADAGSQSGSGKSTIIGLIERFYDPLRGMVKIDGRDIKTYNLRCLRHHISLVGQEPTLFGGSIRDNILYGKENATELEMIEAAKAANAHDFISGLEKGYDTECGERGVQLSGGQKQRIAIARAIIKNPNILLLDEATSALDSQSEKVVQEALDRIMVGRTSIVVAHRLGTIQNADFIAVIEDGMIVEQGSHNDLINKGEGSSYFSLVRMQQRQQNKRVPNKKIARRKGVINFGKV
eukprot:Gb_08703 [translate_table: standard]